MTSGNITQLDKIVSGKDSVTTANYTHVLNQGTENKSNFAKLRPAQSNLNPAGWDELALTANQVIGRFVGLMTIVPVTN